MDSRLYIQRAENEIKISRMLVRLSERFDVQKNMFDIAFPETYYSAVISHAYYAIFYMAKAYLLTKDTRTKLPEEHKRTYEEFKKLVEQGLVDVELLKIYKQLMLRADTLLKIFQTEKNKRGTFTYRSLPQANEQPAKESLKNAQTFFKHLYDLCV